MKKLVLAMLVAAMAVPAFAAVNINATDEGNGVLKLWYDCTEGEIIRGIALRIEADGNATIANNGAATVLALWEIDGKSFGFNTYMDYAFTVESVTAGLYEIDAGHPLAKVGEHGVLESFPASLFSVSMGALDQLGEQAGVGGMGELMTIKFDLTADAVISIAVDTLRGGVVGDVAGVSFLPEIVTVQPSQTLSATQTGFMLTASSGTGGSVTVPGEGAFGPYAAGSTVDLTAVAAYGYVFTSWTGDVANASAATTTITMNDDEAVVANFGFAFPACQDYNLTKSVAGGTDNVVNLADLTNFINYVNNNKTGSTFIVAATNPNYDARYNFVTPSAINLADLTSMVNFVNKYKAGSTFIVNCGTWVPRED